MKKKKKPRLFIFSSQGSSCGMGSMENEVEKQHIRKMNYSQTYIQGLVRLAELDQNCPPDLITSMSQYSAPWAMVQR